MLKDVKKVTPLYTIADVARIIDVNASTLRQWVRGYKHEFGGNRNTVIGEPLVTSNKTAKQGQACIPFIGLVEAFVLAEFRNQLGMSFQQIRPVLKKLKKEFGISNPLASKRLYADGARIFLDTSENNKFSEPNKLSDLVDLKNNNAVFVPTIARYLKHIKYGKDGYADVIALPRFKTSEVIIDPKKYFGDPVLKKSGVRIEDLADRFWGGDTIEEICEDFGVEKLLMEEIIRETNRPAA